MRGERYWFWLRPYVTVKGESESELMKTDRRLEPWALARDITSSAFLSCNHIGSNRFFTKLSKEKTFLKAHNNIIIDGSKQMLLSSFYICLQRSFDTKNIFYTDDKFKTLIEGF